MSQAAYSFLFLCLMTAFAGFAGLAGEFSEVAQVLSVAFFVMLVLSVMHRHVVARGGNLPLYPPL